MIAIARAFPGIVAAIVAAAAMRAAAAELAAFHHWAAHLACP